jgi:hypothetical protein
MVVLLTTVEITGFAENVEKLGEYELFHDCGLLCFHRKHSVSRFAPGFLVTFLLPPSHQWPIMLCFTIGSVSRKPPTYTTISCIEEPFKATQDPKLDFTEIV